MRPLKCECGICKTCIHREYVRTNRAFYRRHAQPEKELSRETWSNRPNPTSGPLRSTWVLVEEALRNR